MSAVAETAPTPTDKLGFFFCLAAALHASVILGVGFTEELRQRSAPRLEITLAKHKSEPNPDADFLAQQDQQGSGTLEEKALLTTDKQRPMRDTLHSSPETLTLAKRKLAADNQKLLSTSAQAQQQTAQADKEKEQVPEIIDGPAESTRLSREIASLQAKLDLQRQAYAKRPRVRTLTSSSTKRAIEAEYLHNWRTEVETIGNNNYPDEEHHSFSPIQSLSNIDRAVAISDSKTTSDSIAASNHSGRPIDTTAMALSMSAKAAT